MSNKVKPCHEIRLGRIRATVWANEYEGVVRHNVTLSRLYKEDGGQWKDSTSFGRDDLPLVAKVADMVHTWIYEHGGEQAASVQKQSEVNGPTAVSS